MNSRAEPEAAAIRRLAFRRQFFLGGAGLEAFPDWARLRIAGTSWLSVHPDLDVCQATGANKSITLVGYVLDPNTPAAGNAEIVGRLLGALDTCETFWTHTADLGGRWVLIVDDGRDTLLLHDAGGQRSVYYAYDQSEGRVVCASRPLLIAEQLGLSKSEGARTYFAAQKHDDCDVYWTPGDTSLYEGVRCLLPNHALNLRTGEVRRYWPDAGLSPRSLEEGLADSQRLLRGLLQSARRRFPLALSMTAGWDSRLMLALGRDIKDDLYYFTLVYPHSEHSRDVRVPSTLLKELGLPHDLIPYPERIDLDFKAVYQRNVAAGLDAYCADAQALYERYPKDRVCITGDIAEIVKCYYSLDGVDEGSVSGRDLVDLSKVTDHPFLVQALDRWLESARTGHVRLLDLFCWEQFVGKKQALIRAQYDIVQESFAPLNCRSLLVTMLSVDEQYRCAPDYTMFRRLVEALWSETLRVPVNPEEHARLRRTVRHMLDRLHLYDRLPEAVKELGRRVIVR